MRFLKRERQDPEENHPSWELGGEALRAEADRNTERKGSWLMQCGIHATRDMEGRVVC